MIHDSQLNCVFYNKNKNNPKCNVLKEDDVSSSERVIMSSVLKVLRTQKSKFRDDFLVLFTIKK